MGNPPETFQMLAKTLFGFEEPVAAELAELGARDVRVQNRSVAFRGDRRLLYRVNYCSHLATRILAPIGSFPATDRESLYRGVSRIDWSRYMDVDQTFSFSATALASRFTNSMFVSQCAKDALVDQMRRRYGRRPSVDIDAPDVRLHLHVDRERATVSLDSSGEHLHHRGYRRGSGDAPLNEVLAAGILALTGWDRRSPLVDPMCGSGTLPIEAARMARRIPPGLVRPGFGFMKWRDFDSRLLAEVAQEAQAGVLGRLDFPIVGSDIDRKRIAEARENARESLVGEDIVFEHKAMAIQQPPPGPGVVVMNPPYGERLGVRDIEQLYGSIGDALKQRFAGYEAWVLTSNLDAAKRIGLRPSRRIKLFNGPLECRLLRFALYEGSVKSKHYPEASGEGDG